ncbi:hypothetical protein EVD32_06555 [Bacteroidales bacterium SW299]|nr:hypothetical protein [Bacteroidales bacterium SW299]
MKKLIVCLFSCFMLGIVSCGNDEITENMPEPLPEQPEDSPSDKPTDQPSDEPVNWHVSPNGNDENTGTEEQPFKTIQTALGKVNPGDIIFLHEGRYYEFVIPSRSGEQNKPITIKSFPGETAYIDGSQFEISGWKALVHIENVSWLTLEDLHICNAIKTAVASDPTGISVRGNSKHITIRNCKVYEIKNDCTRADQDAGKDWRSGHAIAVLGNNDKSSISDLLIEKCEIYEIHSGTSESVTIAGNVDGFTIQDNYVHDVENIGIIAAGGDNLNPGGDINVNFARNGVIRRNKVHRASMDKSQDYWGGNGSNYGAIGIYVCGSSDIIVEQNFVSECDRGIGLVSESDLLATQNCYVRSNIVYNCFRTGIYMGDYKNFVGKGTKNCYVLNNTLYSNNRIGGAYVGEDDTTSEGELRFSENCTNNTIMNNLVYSTTDRDIFFRKYWQSGSGNKIDYNHYYSTDSNSKRWMWDGQMYTDFNEWKNACGGDEHSTFDFDPQFKSLDPESPDFLRLKDESPLKGKGTWMSSYFVGNEDIDGDARTDGESINIGADQ